MGEVHGSNPTLSSKYIFQFTALILQNLQTPVKLEKMPERSQITTHARSRLSQHVKNKEYAYGILYTALHICLWELDPFHRAGLSTSDRREEEGNHEWELTQHLPISLSL